MLVYAFDHPHDPPAAALRGLLGGKGAGLAEMTTALGLPVPPGFTVTTDACRSYLRGGWPLGLDEALRGGIARLEAALGRGFGSPADPLLVSVRSGAPVSMPGMLDTVLDVGVTRTTAVGLAARAGTVFAEECRARLAETFQSAAGANAVPEDPWLQLRAAVEAVFRSWHGARARAYRERQGIPDDLGTAVSVQAMVFGNVDDRSATGVLFTRDPATGEAVPYGDVLFRAQGDEVVSGRRRTEPIAALAARLPRAAEELFRAAAALERHHRDLCDIEFTVERGKLWLLQARVGQRSPRAALRIALELAQDPDFPLARAEAVRRVAPLLRAPPRLATARARGAAPAARGVGASPGFASGEVALDPDAAVAAAAQGRPVILVRDETSPEDVRGFAVASGILTARGGPASHAAVVARAWGIPAVVGVEALALADGAASLAGERLATGELLSLDGSTGEVFRGRIEADDAPAPEAVTLLAWARELGVDLGDAGVAVVPAPLAPPSAGAGPDALLRALSLKGAAASSALAAAVGAGPAEVEAALEALRAGGLVEAARPTGVRLGAPGRERAGGLLEEDRKQLGADRARSALERFHDFDGTFKRVVTDWQLRERGGETVPNDHADADYDAAVLLRLRALHDTALAWLGDLAPSLPRLATYRVRLENALVAILAGDARYVASPRVDSYHGVWFELHEDAIRLAGRTRAEEVASGRAG